jgi:hypothetical protein
MPVPNVGTQCQHGTGERPMREVHGGHDAERHPHRHARDALADAPGKHARDHAHNPRKLEILHDSAARIAETLRYRKVVQEYEAKHAVGQPKPQESKPEHASPEARERPSVDREIKAALAEVDERTARLPDQAAKKRKPERPWLPRADMVKAISDVGLLVTTISVALGDASAKWDAVAAGAVTAVVSNVAWANRRWKEKHGDRPEDRADHQDDARLRNTP